MKNRGKSFLFMLLLLFLLSACNNSSTESATPGPMPSEMSTPTPSTEVTSFFSNVTWSFDENAGCLSFWGHGSLSDIELEAGDSNSHYEWDSLADAAKTIIIGEGITKIPDFSFYGFSKTSSVTLPSTLQFIGSYAFSQCSFEELTIPESVEQIGIGAFANCKQLRSCDIRGKILSLEELSFSGCTEMQNIWFQEGLMELQKDCLRDCNEINILLIPSSVTNLEELHANGIKSLMFLGDPPMMPCNPETGKYWDNYASLKRVYYPEGNEKWVEFIAGCTDDITWIEGIPEDGE